MLIIGAHVTADGDIMKALRKVKKFVGGYGKGRVGENSEAHVAALQLFLSNPCSVRKANGVGEKWTDKLVKEVRDYSEKEGIVLVIHSKYLLNLCRPVDGRNMWALRSLIDDMIIADKIGAVGCVVHMGSRGSVGMKEAEKLMRKSVEFVLKDKDVRGGKAKVILETSSAEGTKIGGNLDEMASLWKGFGAGVRKRVGVCVDTAHIFAGGHDIHKVGGLKRYFAAFNRKIGLENLVVIHLNDSAREFHSRVDKHCGLGKGYIFDVKGVKRMKEVGKNGGGEGRLEELLTVADKWNIPIILETHDDYEKELKLLKKLANDLFIQVGGNKGGSKGGGNEDLVRHFEKLRDFHHSFGSDHIHEYNAYRKIVKILKSYPKPIRSVSNVQGVEGIGKRTLEKIDEILRTGSLKMLKNVESNKRLVAKMKLQTVMGIGPSKAGELVRRGVFTVADLKKAVSRGEVKLNDKQMIALKYSNDLDERIPRSEVKRFGTAIGKVVKEVGDGCRAELAGSYAYGAKDSGDVDVIVVCKGLWTKKDVMRSGEEVLRGVVDALVREGVVIEVLDLGKSKFMGLGRVGARGKVRHIDIRLASEDAVEMFRLYFGSGAEFSRWIRGVARDKGYKLNEWGLEDRRTGRRVDDGTERGVFKKLGLDYVKPANRK